MGHTLGLKAAVVVVTYNNSTTLASLVEGLSNQSEAVSELVIRDNGSSDRTVEVAYATAAQLPFPVKVVVGENVGFAAGVDAAATSLEDPSRPLLVLNPDVILAPGIVLKMLRLAACLEHVGIVTAPLNLVSGAPDPASRRRLPRLGSAALYAALSRWTPRSVRYNDVLPEETTVESQSNLRYTALEATTGALMLVTPSFRNAATGIFDRSYWMYGEDLQLCFDARQEGRSVVMLEEQGSIHIKGASSGLPRSAVADRAFHNAMYLYYRLNLRRGPVESAFVGTGVFIHWMISRGRAFVGGLLGPIRSLW